MIHFNTFLPVAIHASVEAGKKIMDVYRSSFSIELKEDRSPLTLADKLSNETIVSVLKPTGLPLLSEEGKSVSYIERKDWELFWLIDPLDGTKEFIKKNGEFTVNIALIQKGKPVLGVIYVPANDRLYFGNDNDGSFLLEKAMKFLEGEKSDVLNVNSLREKSKPLPLSFTPSAYTIAASRSHLSPETEVLVSKLKSVHGEINFISKGSSLKFCLVAEGSANLYPRLAPTMEWDTAAGDAIARNAGCTTAIYETGTPMVYNKENLLNPWFVVDRK